MSSVTPSLSGEGQRPISEAQARTVRQMMVERGVTLAEDKFPTTSFQASVRINQLNEMTSAATTPLQFAKIRDLAGQLGKNAISYDEWKTLVDSGGSFDPDTQYRVPELATHASLKIRSLARTIYILTAQNATKDDFVTSDSGLGADNAPFVSDDNLSEAALVAAEDNGSDEEIPF